MPDQTFYSVSSDSPQATALVAYLVGLGAPTPTLEDVLVTYPGGSYVNHTLTFNAAGKEPFEALLALGVAAPGVLANELAKYGFIELEVPVPSNLPVPGVNVPPVPPPAPIVLPPALTTPLGAQYTQGPSVVGSRYFVAPRDTSPNGALWKDQAGSIFQKHQVLTPFGNSDYWERVA